MHFLIVPVCDTNDKCKDYLDNLLDSIRRGGYYQNNYQVILCYDNCSDEFQQYFRKKYNGDFIAAISNRNTKNLNFAANSNTGLREAFKAAQDNNDPNAHFTILNMDTVLPNTYVFDSLAGQGLSFPNPVDDIEGVLNPRPSPGPNCGSLPEKTSVTKFSGFCMCLSYAAVDKVGVMDERFPGSFNDDDLAVRVALAGFPVEVVSIDVHHELKDRKTPSNTGAYDERELGVGLFKFRRKYSIPANIAHESFNQWILCNYTWDDLLKCP